MSMSATWNKFKRMLSISDKGNKPEKGEIVLGKTDSGTNIRASVSGRKQRISTDPQMGLLMRSQLRGSKGEAVARLESKLGLHNLMPGEGGDDESRRSVVLTRRFRSFLDARRISSRPLIILRSSEDNILRMRDDMDKQEQDDAITILPADEMDTLTSEIKQWYKNRQAFRAIFGATMFSGITLLLISIFFSVYWYAEPPLFPGNFNRTGSKYYNVHMCGEVASLLLMSIGILTFRLLPRSTLKCVTSIHTLVLLVSFFLTTVSMYCAINHHKLYTGNDAHFYSLHSWIGLIAYFLFSLSVITGIILLYYPGQVLRKLHSPFAMLTFMLCAVGSVSGFFDRTLIQMTHQASSWEVSGTLANLCGILLLLQCIFTRIGIASVRYKRRPKPQWDVIVYRSLETIEDTFLDIHDQYDTFEDWVSDVNKTRLKALNIRSTLANKVEKPIET